MLCSSNTLLHLLLYASCFQYLKLFPILNTTNKQLLFEKRKQCDSTKWKHTKECEWRQDVIGRCMWSVRKSVQGHLPQSLSASPVGRLDMSANFRLTWENIYLAIIVNWSTRASSPISVDPDQPVSFIYYSLTHMEPAHTSRPISCVFALSQSSCSCLVCVCLLCCVRFELLCGFCFRLEEVFMWQKNWSGLWHTAVIQGISSFNILMLFFLYLVFIFEDNQNGYISDIVLFILCVFIEKIFNVHWETSFCRKWYKLVGEKPRSRSRIDFILISRFVFIL